jgi:hypothetical protein
MSVVVGCRSTRRWHVKTNAELQSALHMVLARLEVPQDAAGWLAIVEALDASVRYARKTHDLALKLKAKEGAR